MLYIYIHTYTHDIYIYIHDIWSVVAVQFVLADRNTCQNTHFLHIVRMFLHQGGHSVVQFQTMAKRQDLIYPYFIFLRFRNRSSAVMKSLYVSKIAICWGVQFLQEIIGEKTENMQGYVGDSAAALNRSCYNSESQLTNHSNKSHNTGL